MAHRPGMTRRELADRYHVSLRTINRWAEEDEWQPLPDKRGAEYEYDTDVTDAAVKARTGREDPVPIGHSQLTRAEIARVYGVSYQTAKDYARRGHFGTEDGEGCFSAAKVADYMANRRRYRKAETAEPASS